jgi:hypothetical protein
LRHSFTSPSKYMIRSTQQHTPHPWSPGSLCVSF